jgi:hypothetical protein
VRVTDVVGHKGARRMFKVVMKYSDGTTEEDDEVFQSETRG